MSKEIKYYGIAKFIDDFCTNNDGNKFKNPFWYIYPKELELKIKHQGTHTTFTDINITSED